jgi:hypothetical protein
MITKKGHNNAWNRSFNCVCNGACTTVVDDQSHSWEEPTMGYRVVYHHHIICVGCVDTLNANVREYQCAPFRNSHSL